MAASSKGRVGAQTSLVIAGKTGLTFCTFVTTVLLTRHLGVKAFGVFSVCTTLIVLFSGIVNDALDFGVLRSAPLCLLKNDRQRSLLILKVAFKLKAALGLVLLFLAFPIASPLGRIILQEEDTGWLIRLAFLGIWGTLLLRSASIYLQVHENFSKYLVLDSFLTGGKFVLVLGLLLSQSLTTLSSVSVAALTPFLAFLLAGLIVPRDFLAVRGPEKEVGLELLHFSKWLMLCFVIHAIHSRLDLLLLSVLKGSEEAGIYAAAFNLAFIAEIVASFLIVVFNPKIMPLCQEGKFHGFLLRFLKLMVPICLTGGALAVIISRWVIPLMYGSTYDDSVLIFQLLVPGMIVSMLVLPLAIPFLNLNRPRLALVMELVSLTLILGANLFAIPRYGAVGAAIVTLCVRSLVGGLVLAWVLDSASGSSTGASSG